MILRVIGFCGVIFAISADVQADAEIWLARTAECNSCEIFEQVAERRDYGESIEYESGDTNLHIPLRYVDKNELDGDILSQLSESHRESKHWDAILTVLVVDDGDVLSHGNIAESADLRDIRHSEEKMFPPDRPDDDHPVFAEEDLYTPFFVANWNLEYFVALALGERSPIASGRPVDLEAPDPIQLGLANVILWGSAGTPSGNAQYIPARIREISSNLGHLELENVQYTTLYGHGPDTDGNDTAYMVDEEIRFRRADIASDLAADANGLNRVFTGVRESTDSRSLLIQVGHSGPAGSPLWGSALTLLPADLEPFESESAGELVMVSGACHSGLFASVGQCGFFAAHPEVIATGCQRSPEAIEESDDYLRYFFRAATGIVDTNEGQGAAINSGAPSMYAAHWYASVRLEDHQISYTSTDAHIDAYFEAHPDQLPESLSVRQMRALDDTLNDAESRALEIMTKNLSADTEIPLTGHVERNHVAQEALAGHREMPSVERNRITDLEYKLVLPQLARRLAYYSVAPEAESYTASSACEQRSVAEFLKAES